MAKEKIERFEDLITWQKARELTGGIYKITKLGDFSKDYGLKEQIRKASVSIMSNIAEGFDRGGRSEFHQFLVIAKGSCAEVRSQLYVALDVGYVTESEFHTLYSLAIETARLVGALRSAVYRQKKKLSSKS
jgi:four helix bundle protein